MKIRMGFVSNSSTSSFLIAGKLMNKVEMMVFFNMTSEAFEDWKCSGDDINKMSIMPINDGDDYVVGYYIHNMCDLDDVIAIVNSAKEKFGKTGKLYRCISDWSGNTYVDN